MKFLFYDMGSYIYHDFLFYLRKMGNTVKTVYYNFPNRYEDAFFCERFADYLEKDTYDAVISINFFPLVAVLCDTYHIKYISWSYDSPLAEDLENYFNFETNYIFLFDRVEAEQYQAKGYANVFHLPLAVNTDRLDIVLTSSYARRKTLHQCDISFVGRLYESRLDILLYAVDDYTKGYIEGLLQSQMQLYGCYLLDELITDELLHSVNGALKKINENSSLLNLRGLRYLIAEHITHLERRILLTQFGELFDVHLYTNKPCRLPHIKDMGSVNYMEEMPFVFHYSKLNLNATLKCIQSGIPLRALDIMGAGGTLLSNYQPELAECFTDGEDIIMYENIDDAIAKADFYLRQDDLRREIAEKGYHKVKKLFTYPARIQELFRITSLK